MEHIIHIYKLKIVFLSLNQLKIPTSLAYSTVCTNIQEVTEDTASPAVKFPCQAVIMEKKENFQTHIM